MFQTGKSKINKKRYRDDAKKSKKVKTKPKVTEASDDEEIKSDEDVLGAEDEVENDWAIDEDNEYETPAQKKLRLAKKYLDEVAEKEREEASDEENLDNRIGQRLKEDYLEEQGRLRKKVAHLYDGFDADTIVTLKHRFQKASMTCVCVDEKEEFLFTGCKNEQVLKWKLNDCKIVFKINLKEGNPDAKGHRFTQCMALSSNGKYLAIGDGSIHVQIYCPSTGKKLGTLKGHRSAVTCLVFRKNTSQLYTASADRSLRVWSLDEMTFVEALFGHQTAVTGIDALSRERAISSGGADQTIRIWKIVEDSQLVYTGHEGSIEDVKLLNEENFISCGDDGQICTWNPGKKKPLASVKKAHGVQASSGTPNWISALAVLLNTDICASGSCDGYVRLWKLENECSKIMPLMAIPSIQGFVNHLRFLSNGTKIIASVGQEHRLGRWWTDKSARNCLKIISLIVKPEEK